MAVNIQSANLVGVISAEGSLIGKATAEVCLLGKAQVVNGTGNLYEGDCTIIPKCADQVMPTKNKLMTDDVKVKAIPYYSVDNDKGTTFIIGE